MMSMEIELSGSTLRLDPSGAIYWPTRNCLLLADLHLGKETVFQKAGMAIPQGATTSTLNRMRSLVQLYQPMQVIVLGDLLHAPVGLTPSLTEALSEIVRESEERSWILVPGNHDRGSITALRQCGWEVTALRYVVDGITLVHDASRWTENDPASISGHLHPSIRIPLTRRESTCVRCFWQRGQNLFTPAFGGWTGTQSVKASRCDRVLACVDGELVEWPGLRTA